jgi:hypothetical protein
MTKLNLCPLELDILVVRAHQNRNGRIYQLNKPSLHHLVGQRAYSFPVVCLCVVRTFVGILSVGFRDLAICTYHACPQFNSTSQP